MRACYADALLAYTLRAVKAKKTMEEEATENERAHDSLLLEKRLEKEREAREACCATRLKLLSYLSGT